VVGFDHKSGEIRTFAVDRIRELELGDQHFEVSQDFDFDRYIGSSFGVIADRAVRVRIRFDPRWAGYVEERTWHDSQRFEKARDGRLELCMDVGSTPDLRSWILSFGSGAEVLEPLELRAQVARELEGARARYARASRRAQASS
jgi:proteasome accessory factor B